jgi:hypothetical protein
MNKEPAFQMPALLRWTARDKPTVCDGILIPTGASDCSGLYHIAIPLCRPYFNPHQTLAMADCLNECAQKLLFSFSSVSESFTRVEVDSYMSFS